MSDEKNEKQSRTRSPAYPAINLEDAIGKADAIWKKATRHAVPIDVVGTYWGYGSESSAGFSAASALKKYGLIIEEGSKEKRNVRLSELAIKLIYNPDVESPEYANALKEAALNPAIHAELWSKYGGNLPDDAVIKRYLVVERKFNDAYVDGFIADFRHSIAIAKLIEGDTVYPQQENTLEMAPKVQHTIGQFVSPKPFGQPPDTLAPHPGALIYSHELSLPLESGKIVKIPRMSEDDYELMLETLKLWKRRIVEPKAANPVEE